jgi:hypothetical protein
MGGAYAYEEEDDDEWLSGPDPARAANDPYGYYYDCCNGLGDSRGCAMDWHREKKYCYAREQRKPKIRGYADDASD